MNASDAIKTHYSLAFRTIAMNTGQIGMSRRLAGLDGVIKGPQERAAAETSA